MNRIVMPLAFIKICFIFYDQSIRLDVINIQRNGVLFTSTTEVVGNYPLVLESSDKTSIFSTLPEKDHCPTDSQIDIVLQILDGLSRSGGYIELNAITTSV